MDWADWQSYAAPAVVLVVLLLFLRGWLKKSGSGCSQGGCKCGVSQVKKKGGRR